MKRVHIVNPYNSIAMQYMSQPLDELKTLYDLTTSTEIDPAADVNIHIPWHTLAGWERPEGSATRNIIAYTHCNPSAEDSLLDACERADIVTAMSFTGRRELVHLGVDPKKIWVNYCAANQFQFRRRLIAIVGYPQPNGRKRESLLFDLAYRYNLKHYEFLFVGNGWEDIANRLMSLGVNVQAFHADNYDAINTIYQRVDALLVTGYIEGGPLPLLEAMASGCKVFSPRFGYAADLLSEAELYDTPDELMDKLDAYFGLAIDNAYLAHIWTWNDYAAEYALLAGKLTGESVDLYPNRGMSRYAQLLDVVDEIHPKSIVEVGTWRGDSALRMIQQAAKWRQMEDIFYQGFDLFEGQTKADFRRELSKSGFPQEIVQRRLSATGAGVMLVAGYTRDTLPAHLKADADLFFIDGGHSEETIASDGDLVYSMKETAIAIFDDWYEEPKPEGFGCNKFIESLNPSEFKITWLSALTETNDGRTIGMVRVERRKANAAIPVQMSTQTPALAYS